MGKFNISTKGGQIDELTQKAHADLPVGEVVSQEEPAPTSGNIEALLSSAPDLETLQEGVQAGAEAEIAADQQRERERVPDILTRFQSPEENTWNYSDTRAKAAAASKGASDDGGLKQRSRNLGQMLESGDKSVLAIGGLRAQDTNPIKDVLSTIEAITPDGTFNNQFGNILSVITENRISQLAFNEPIEGDIRQEPDVEVSGEPTLVKKGDKKPRPVSKLEGNKQLGKEIHRDWMRYKNSQEGKPTDERPDISDEQATLLGDAAKELYYRANKTDKGEQFMKRYQTPDGNVLFELTPHAITQLSKGDYQRKKMLPKQDVRPSKIPLKGGKLTAEGKTYTKSISSKAGKPDGLEVLNEAMHNLGQVPNVVDPQRLKILLATAMPVLAGDVTPDSPFATINHVGKDKMDAFIVKSKEDANYSPEENYENIVNNLAQDVYNVVNEKDGANYLSYYIQAYNGRIAPQQTGFDPTSSKTVRFVTRNAVPSKATPGSRVDKNLRQMYAMMLVKGADAYLPEARELALQSATPQLLSWGQELKNAIDSIPDAQVQQVIDGIKNKTPVSQLPKLPVPELSPELAQTIAKKGEDGQAFIDGLIDFVEYHDKNTKGLPHFSYFNAYMDGKTNGLAANGIQMGSEKVAYKTGVLRKKKNQKFLLDNNEDIRDDLKNVLLTSIDNDGFAGIEEKFNGEIPSIARKVYSNRDLNKKTTMTFGYGMELDSMKKNIRETLGLLAESDPELAASIQQATNNDPEAREELVNVLHGKYVEGLAQALDPDALDSRALMRSAAVLHAITNELFTIKSPIGLDLNFGGDVTTGTEFLTDYKVYDQGERRTVSAVQPVSEITSAAEKRRTDEEGELVLEPGGIAYGGAVPGPVQSTDAATVALTASGRSWSKLRAKSNGNPYIHTIYDAFKVDAMGYDTVLEETNNNWLKANFNWSYLKETKRSIDELNKKWSEKIRGRDNSETLSDQEAIMFKYFLEPVVNKKTGKSFPRKLNNKLKKLLPNPDESYDATQRIIKAMQQAKYNVYKPTQPNVGQLKTFVNAMSREIGLSDRLNYMIDKVDSKKEKLRSKIKSDGHKVYQYYAH